jgi:SSS family solute:Na+ symporter
MKVLYIATIAFGILGMAAAFIMSKFGQGFKLWQTLAGILSGGMLGLFILGMISRKAGNAVGIISTLLGVIVIVWMTMSKTCPDFFGKYLYTWNSYLIPVIGTLVILFAGFALSRIIRIKKV